MKNYLVKCCGLALLTLYGCGSGSSSGGSTAPAVSKPNKTDDITAIQTTPKPDDLKVKGINTKEVLLSDAIIPSYRLEPNQELKSALNEVLARTNQYRKEKGLPALRMDNHLMAYAMLRAKEIASYFEHKRLNGDSPLDTKYFKVIGNRGENIATGHKNAQSVSQGWRDSAGHYENMVSKDYTRLGMGYYFDENNKYHHQWVQLFGDDKLQTIYDFVKPLNAQAVISALGEKTRYGDDATLTINASKQTATHSVYDDPYVIELSGGHRIVLASTGDWKYQTIGEVATQQTGIPEAYLNVGQSYELPNNLQATYTGKAMGDLGQNYRVRAEIKATINDKNMALTVFNAQKDQQHILAGKAADFKSAAELNFSDNLSWNASNNQFESQSGKARLYGKDASEIGGQFHKTVSGQHYRGVYAGKKQKSHE